MDLNGRTIIEKDSHGDGFAAQLDYCADERSVDKLGIHDDRHDEVALDFLSLGSHAAGKSITSSK